MKPILNYFVALFFLTLLASEVITHARNIIVHCKYGQSRSKGVALAIEKMTKRDVLYANSNGRLRKYREEDDDGYYNRRAYELVLMEHMEHEMRLEKD